MKGNTGKIIEVDLTSGKIEITRLPEAYYTKYVGGSGLGAKLFWDRGDFDADPLSPEAMLIIMNGPFAGLRLSGTSRNSVMGRSPLTGGFADSSCGGYFAPELRYAGFDGIVITGASRTPSLLLIEDDHIELADAHAYWGDGVEETDKALKEQYGKKFRTLVIGPAGENRVRYANILNEAHHAFGRAGFGAIMGAKNLKAIIVNGTKRAVEMADRKRFEELRAELNPRIREGLISEVLHDFGTAGSLEGHVYDGDVPIKNWTSNYWEEMAEALTGSTLEEKYLTKRATCAFCSIACKRIVSVKEGPFAIPEGPGPEYETIVSFGSLLGSMDLAATCKAGRLCNDLGMDTISAGATIAWAMEAFERGDLTLEDTGGIDLKWGDMKRVMDLLPMIAKGEGKIGSLLSRGSLWAANKIGKGSIAYTAQSKGLEAPMHDPRGGGHGKALAYAISPRGACHVSSTMHFMESGACYYPEIGFDYDLEPMTGELKPEVAVVAVELGNIENSACYCQFADRQITMTEWVELFNAVAGYGWDIPDMMQAGRRIFYLKRLLNYRFGFRADDDDLTPRMLEPARDGEPEGVEMDLAGMKERFYELIGLDPKKGIPLKGTLVRYHMADEAELVWEEDEYTTVTRKI